MVGIRSSLVASPLAAGRPAKPKEVADLARMPGRQELLAMLLGTMQAPIAQFVRTLNEVPGKFVRTVAAIKDQKEKQPA